MKAMRSHGTANGKRINALNDECGGVAPGDSAPTPPETGEGGGGMPDSAGADLQGPGSSCSCTLGSSQGHTGSLAAMLETRWRDCVDKSHREATGRGREQDTSIPAEPIPS